MLKTSTIIACVLVVSAPVAMAQSSGSVGDPKASVQEAMAPMTPEERAKRMFILDEHGSVYDSRGDLITPRRTKK